MITGRSGRSGRSLFREPWAVDVIVR